jgi:hypothetical protein
LKQNRQRQRVGHLWQNRFFSRALEAAHPLTALHHVDLNPVRAGMTATAGDWPWSSARPHTSPEVRHELLDWPWTAWMEEMRLGWNHEDWRGPQEAVASSLKRKLRPRPSVVARVSEERLWVGLSRALRWSRSGVPPGSASHWARTLS